MWKKITLYKYQRLEEIELRKIDPIDKVLYSTCVVYNLTEWQLDNMNPKKATKKILRMTKILESKVNPVAKNRIGKYWINYDISKMTFGQYIEIAYFIQSGVLPSIHFILASCSHLPFTKNNPNKHSIRSEYFLHKPIEITLGSALLIINNFNEFNKKYKGLFGLKSNNEEMDDDTIRRINKEEQDPFNRQFGWIYSATQVAEHERITLDKAFALPVTQAMNALSFLKAKGKYQERQLKNK